jgi:hypothetical protein
MQFEVGCGFRDFKVLVSRRPLTFASNRKNFGLISMSPGDSRSMRILKRDTPVRQVESSSDSDRLNASSEALAKAFAEKEDNYASVCLL